MHIGSFSDMGLLALAKKFAGSGSGGGAGWHFEIVTVLPDASTADSSALYLLLTGTSSEGVNSYDEYIVVNGAWESLGSLDINLDNYATKDDLNAITAIVSLDSLDLEDYTGTTIEFVNAIRSSTMAVGSMAIGGVSLSDLPGELSNCEIVVTRTHSQVTNLAISSNNRAPYQWFFNHWIGGDEDTNVWRTYTESVEEDIAAIGQSILNITESIAATNADITAINETVSGIEDELDDIQVELEGVVDDIEEIETAIAEVHTYLQKVVRDGETTFAAADNTDYQWSTAQEDIRVTLPAITDLTRTHIINLNFIAGNDGPLMLFGDFATPVMWSFIEGCEYQIQLKYIENEWKIRRYCPEDETTEQRVWGIDEIAGINDVSTMTELFTAIGNTPGIPNYAIITGIISFGTLPSGISQGEITVRKVPNASISAYTAELSASGSAPYRWYWNGNSWTPYSSKALTTLSQTAPTISTVKDGQVYNLTASIVSLNIISISQSVTGDETIIYCTTGDTIEFTYPDSIKAIGDAELKPNTQYVISIRNSIMVVGEVA